MTRAEREALAALLDQASAEISGFLAEDDERGENTATSHRIADDLTSAAAALRAEGNDEPNVDELLVLNDICRAVLGDAKWKGLLESTQQVVRLRVRALLPARVLRAMRDGPVTNAEPCIACAGFGWIYDPNEQGDGMTEPRKIDCPKCGTEGR